MSSVKQNEKLRKSSSETIAREMKQINVLQKQMMDEAKRILPNNEIKQIQENYKRYEADIISLKQKAEVLHKQYLPLTQQVRELIVQAVKTSQRIEGYTTESTKNIQEEVRRIKERYNVKVST